MLGRDVFENFHVYNSALTVIFLFAPVDCTQVAVPAVMPVVAEAMETQAPLG